MLWKKCSNPQTFFMLPPTKIEKVKCMCISKAYIVLILQQSLWRRYILQSHKANNWAPRADRIRNPCHATEFEGNSHELWKCLFFSLPTVEVSPSWTASILGVQEWILTWWRTVQNKSNVSFLLPPPNSRHPHNMHLLTRQPIRTHPCAKHCIKLWG